MFSMAGLSDLLPEFMQGTLTEEKMSPFSIKLQELVKTTLPEFMTLHPELALFQNA